MPAELTPRERIAKLETWREEHTRQEDLEHHKQQSHLDRRIIVIAALIGLFGVLVGAALSAWLLTLLSK